MERNFAVCGQRKLESGKTIRKIKWVGSTVVGFENGGKKQI